MIQQKEDDSETNQDDISQTYLTSYKYIVLKLSVKLQKYYCNRIIYVIKMS
jgi:hypothetical protein